MTKTEELLETITEQNQTIIKALAVIIQQRENWQTRFKQEEKNDRDTIVNIARKKARVEEK